MAGLLPGILTSDMKRRDFIRLLGSAAVALPFDFAIAAPKRAATTEWPLI
jgi:hypothetical protein